MYCTKCGLQTNSGDIFCAGCGTSLIKITESPEKVNPTSVAEEVKKVDYIPPVPTKVTSKPKPIIKKVGPIGVKGWLLFLVIGLTILWPLFRIGDISKNLSEAENKYPNLVSFDKWQSYKSSIWAFTLIWIALSIYAGLGLAKGKNGEVVKRTIVILLILGPIATLTSGGLIPLIIFGSNNELFQGLLIPFFSSLLAFSLWALYLMKSKRVHNTYGYKKSSSDSYSASPISLQQREQYSKTPLQVNKNIESFSYQAELLNKPSQSDSSITNKTIDQIPRQPGQHLKRKSYISKHWHGDLSLPISFWVNGFLLNLIFLSIINFVPWNNLVDYSPKICSSFGILIWLLLTPISIWQLIGIWQSSSNYIKGGKSKFIGNLVKVIIILNLFNLYSTFTKSGIPQVKEFFKIAIGSDPLGEYQIRVLRDATELEVSGPIAFSLTDDVKKTLNAHPSIKVIHLNSIGGRVSEARKLRDLIDSRKLTTYTSTGCSSACTLAFVAGHRRLIAEKAFLGFHQYGFPGMEKESFSSEYDKDKNDWLGRGISRTFADKAFTTPNSGMWNPSHKELFEAKFITGYPEDDEIALSGVSLNEIENIADGLIKTPLYSSIKSLDSKIFAQIVTEIQIGFQRGRSQVELNQKIRPLLFSVYSKRLPYGSNESLINSVKITLEQMEVLFKIDPNICFDLLFTTNRASLNVSKYFSNELVQKESEAFNDVITSSLMQFKTKQSEEYLQALLTDLLKRLGESYGEDIQLLSNIEMRNKNKARSCQMSYIYFKEILKLPSDDSGDLLRYIFGKVQE